MTPTADSGRPATHRELGLTDGEYEQILDRMGREPSPVELVMFSLMWSEHCAYKHSKKLLGTLPSEGPRVMVGPGENAGVVDVGDGWGIAFKAESHNSPSAINPFSGAATGVGGVVRDILALGARPIASAGSLRFGDLDSTRTRELVRGAVKGIASYGRELGVATVANEIRFETPYEGKPLVNAMSLGLVHRDEMMRAIASGPGNRIVIFGATTGRVGIGGASVLASSELDEEPVSSVPDGDPAEEVKLLAGCREMIEGGLLVGLQDLGAAGLTSAAGEMASSAGTGVDIDVDLVPLAEPDMEPFEIMVSESQERMLAVVEPGNVDAVMAICERVGTLCTVIGTVTDSGRFRVISNRETVGDMAIADLIDGAPLYDLTPEAPEGWDYANRRTLPEGADSTATLQELLASPSIVSHQWAFDQLDSTVGDRTLIGPGEAEAAVLRLPESSRAIATTIGGNGRRVACDPYRGTVEALLDCVASLACVGAEPLGVTNCLNFGNPEKAPRAWELAESVRGLAEVCRELELPVVSGNVSLYNEAPSGPIFPTPVIGLVGEIPNPDGPDRRPWQAGDSVALVGPFRPSLAGSELSRQTGTLEPGLPEFRTDQVHEAAVLVRDAVRSGSTGTVTTVVDGGIATAACRLALDAGVGVSLDLRPVVAGHHCTAEEALFGEAPGGFLVAGSKQHLEQLGGSGVKVEMIGTVGGDTVKLEASGAGPELALDQLAAARDSVAARIATE